MLANASIHLGGLADLALAAQERGNRSGYNDRLCSATETVAKIRPLMPQFGITRLACVTGLDSVGISVWAAIRPNSRTLAQSQGKGIDESAAQASALMEAVEVATAERTDLEFVHASPRALTLSGTSYDRLDGMLRRGSSPIDDDHSIDWLEGHNLITDRPVLVPGETVTLWDARVRSRYWQSTDGLASGNTLWEAVLHGLCERIERDAMALWLLRPDTDVMGRCVDPASFDDPVIRALVQAIALAGLELRLFDASSNTGTPVFTAFIFPPVDGYEHTWKHFDLSSGCGCHPSPLRAAIRAITEAAQTRLTTISAGRDDFDPEVYRQGLDPSLLVYPRSQPIFRHDLKEPTHPDRAKYLPTMIERLRGVGIRSIIVVPMESGERGFAVVKILVPDLESPSGDRQTRFGPRAIAFIEAQS